MPPYEVKTILKYSVNKKMTFTVTPKSEKALSIRETRSISKGHKKGRLKEILSTIGVTLVTAGKALNMFSSVSALSASQM